MIYSPGPVLDGPPAATDPFARLLSEAPWVNVSRCHPSDRLLCDLYFPYPTIILHGWGNRNLWRCPWSLLFSKNPYLVDVGYRASLRERLYIFPSQPRLIFSHLQVYSKCILLGLTSDPDSAISPTPPFHKPIQSLGPFGLSRPRPSSFLFSSYLFPLILPSNFRFFLSHASFDSHPTKEKPQLIASQNSKGFFISNLLIIFIMFY